MFERNTIFCVFQISAGRKALSIRGVEVDRLEAVEQHRDCVYEKSDAGDSCSLQFKKDVQLENLNETENEE